MKNFVKYNIIGVIVFSILVLMSVGYALYGQDLGLNGDIILKKPGNIEIVNVSIVNNECSNLASYNEPSVDGMNLSFNIVGSDTNFRATYLVEIKNGSLSDYTFTSFPFNASINSSENVSISTIITDSSSGEELNPGDIIEAGQSKIYKVVFNIVTDNSNKEVNITGKAEFSSDNSGNIIASITPKSGNLQNGAAACFTVSVANTYKYSRNFNLSSSNSNIVLIDNSGKSLSTLNIAANNTEEYNVCAKASDNSSFLTDSTTTTITLSSAGITSINVGELTLSVDIDLIATDKEAPTIGNVSLSIPDDVTTEGNASISWDRIDSGGSSITNYYIILYNSDTGTSTNYETGSSVTSYLFNGLSEGNYYAKVYGVDEAGNIGSSSCDEATTGNGYCSMSNTTSLKWKFTVTFNLSTLNHDGSTSTTDTATINQSYSTTLKVTSNNYSLPSSVTITMGGNTLTSGTDYTYSSSSGKITINKVTGDITITASGTWSCLVEGTKILLANGKTKNVEDITYNDLLLVWNYETGSYTFEYPIWIEKGNKSHAYQRITFSDGTVLKTVGKHGVFSGDINKFVTVSDPDNFKIGTKIAKIDNNRLTYVFVSNIETIYEEVYYYHVVSTRYYNVIANNILTTDGTVMLSNLYEFGDNINWVNRNYINLALYDYSLLSDIMPYYMFKGMRAEEGKVLEPYMSLGMFRKYLIENQLNDNMLREPNVNDNDKRVWMVTTSDDIFSNYEDYLYEEGSFYVLNNPKNKNNFKYWLNTSDNQIYYPGDKVRVDLGMHFIAVYN